MSATGRGGVRAKIHGSCASRITGSSPRARGRGGSGEWAAEAGEAPREAFHAAIKEANDAFLASIATSRDTLLAVLKDEASTLEQRKTAIAVYKDEVEQAREVRRAAVKDAIADYKAARKAAWEAFRAAIDN